MWRLSESILGENEEQQDNLFGDQEALCSVSPLQVLFLWTRSNFFLLKPKVMIYGDFVDFDE